MKSDVKLEGENKRGKEKGEFLQEKEKDK
jgi:hypothetical protein